LFKTQLKLAELRTGQKKKLKIVAKRKHFFSTALILNNLGGFSTDFKTP